MICTPIFCLSPPHCESNGFGGLRKISGEAHMNASSATKVRGVRVVAHYRRGRDRSSHSLFRQQQGNACGPLDRCRAGALYRTRREASCQEVLRRRKDKESKDVEAAG